MFETVYSKLEKELGVKKQSISKLVASVSQVYEKRDQAVEMLKQA